MRTATRLGLILTMFAPTLGAALPAAEADAASALRRCDDLVFKAQSSDVFYDIRARNVTCRQARATLRAYRAKNARCIAHWRCTYGVEPRWAVGPRIRMTRGRKVIYFAIAA